MRPRSGAGSGEVRLALLAVLVARTGLNAGIRVVFPFLPEIARGLGVSLAAVGGLVALRSLVGTTAPLASILAETLGRRRLMLVGLGVTLVGSAVIGLADGIVVAGVGFVIVGFGKPLFDVPMQGWFAARVPYERRGRVLGITELTWAGGLLASVPLSGWLIARTSWRAPFLVVVVLVVAGLVAVWRLIGDDRPDVRQRAPLRLDRGRLAVLAVVAGFSFAAETMFVVYGAWLEADLGFDVTAIGVFTLLVVASELTGEGGVTAFGDRMGLRRTIAGALLTSTLAYLALSLVGASVAVAVVVVIVWFVSFEVSIVASVPLVSELGGTGRDRMLGLMVAVIAVSRAAGALVAPAAFGSGGIAATGLIAAVGTAVALLVLVLGVPDPQVERRARSGS